MARLEDLTPGALVAGIAGAESVTVVQVEWHGTEVLTLTYRDASGRVEDKLVYRDVEATIEIRERGKAWSFDADGAAFRLASEAKRISLAYLFDPLLAVHTSSLDPLPHQIEAVYGEMLPRQPLRFLLADDPGAGKTIMAGLLIKELIIRGDAQRCLIVAPGGLVEQWQDELWQKLHVEFEIITREAINASKSGNPYVEKNFIISRLDHLSRNDELQAKLDQTDWDLIVVDEAHKMSAHYYGNEVKETKRYRLGRRLGRLTRHLLLMTATPHSGKEEDFQLFMALLDSDRFEGKPRGRKSDTAHTIDTSGLMRRLVKEDLVKFDGKPLFPERRAYTVTYSLSELEARLYGEVTQYVREEMNRAERLKQEGEGGRGAIVGFALTTLQRRLASSPAAIYRSIVRRRNRLEKRLREEKLQSRADSARIQASDQERLITEEDLEEFEDFEDRPDSEVEEIEEALVDEASAAATIAELEIEIDKLAYLERIAERVKESGTDKKWEELSSLLQNRAEMRDSFGSWRKLIVFTEHKDTLEYLAERIRSLIGAPESVVRIHGGVGRDERRKIQEAFTQDPDVHVLVATDAAGEGINLQRAHLLVNYDLPWNPNRIEQRFGRIHRIGQTEVCHMWNLVAAETREGDVYLRLLEKLEQSAKSLGGQVFDVLGAAFDDQPLRDLLIEAVRYGDDPKVRARLDQVVDETVIRGLDRALEERRLIADVMAPTDIERIRDQMEEAEARRLQPHFIRSFFLEAFERLGGRAVKREEGSYQITHVPADVRNRDRSIGAGAPLLRQYERVTFEKDLVAVEGQPLGELVAPGTPLLDSVVDLTLERNRSLLKQGAVLIAPGDVTEAPRVLLYLEHAIQDARTTRSGDRRVVSKRLQFIEIDESGDARQAGYAPYLDYEPAGPEDLALVREALGAPWLTSDFEKTGVDFAVRVAVPEHLAEVRERTTGRVEKTIAAVKERLLSEISYWDHRAKELKDQELAGKKPRLNSAKARQRADELEGRLKKRLEELEQENSLSALPPVIVGGAIVLPGGLMERLRGERSETPATFAKETTRIERLAVDAVLEAERSLGRDPVEMPHNNPGYDIRSKDPATGTIYFIEVKGRVLGARTVTVTRNEILTALNKPDQFVLALVSIDGDQPDIRYVRKPFRGEDETYFGVTSVNFDWTNQWEQGRRPTYAAEADSTSD
ncbi:MAG: RNA helicase [Acidobacteria bacterium]|nr:MAG: RNA helicase [Acidobacteriota bacterium]